MQIVRKEYRGKVYENAFLRQSYREGGKVHKRTVGSLKGLPRAMVEQIRRILRGETLVPVSQAFEVVRSLPHGHVGAVLGTLGKLGVEKLLASRPSHWRDLAVALIVARVIDPCSKLATSRGLGPETAFTTLGESLGVEGADEDELYEAMDWVLARQGRIEEKLARRHLGEGSLVLYDLTSSYYTGSRCSLAQFGHNRDGKKGFRQVVFGLLCNQEGCPVAVEVFAGNVADAQTLGSQVKKVTERFGLRRVALVGDRGVITEARIREELSGVEGLDWITALRGPAIRVLAQAGAIQLSLFDERGLAEITSPDYPGERLIACRNPLLGQERARRRQELLEATERELAKIVVATRREKGRLRGKARIGLRVGKILNRYKVGKHFKVEITEEGFAYRRDEGRIRAEAALDGIYVIRTSLPEESMKAKEAVGAYKGLSAVERAFRSLKTMDLKVRPFHHRLEDRVRAHVFLCMLAYYVEWHMRQSLAPMLFDDEEREEAEALRESVVSPARRSPKAQAKAQRKRTANGEPVHSFQTLLKDLATIVKNRNRFKMAHPGGSDESPWFYTVTTPTHLQQRALDLLGVSLAM
ncbi:MAG TPA: IS1634 family transposase [Dehalococcoidia bacterium]|nr:IS1634 family transposase [Dehalococcoidia bacterium]